MESLLQEVLISIKDIQSEVSSIGNKVHSLEKQMAGLVKVDSIEHRVTVNQIDLSDIREIVERMDLAYSKQLNLIVNTLHKSPQLQFTNIEQRLDVQLMKLAKVEEELLIFKLEGNNVE